MEMMDLETYKNFFEFDAADMAYIGMNETSVDRLIELIASKRFNEIF